MNAILIRQARLQDVPRIAEIHVRSWQAAYQGIMPDAVLDGLSIEKRIVIWNKILGENARGNLVIESDGRVMGWLSFGPCRDADVAGEAEIYGIYLDPTAYRRGLGRLLWLDACHQFELQGHERVAVWVLADNGPARRFYEAMGGQLDPSGQKMFEREGVKLLEVRYWCPIRPPQLNET